MNKTTEERLDAIERAISKLTEQPVHSAPIVPITLIVPPLPKHIKPKDIEVKDIKPKDIEVIENSVVEQKYKPVDFNKGSNA